MGLGQMSNSNEDSPSSCCMAEYGDGTGIDEPASWGQYWVKLGLLRWLWEVQGSAWLI